MIHPDQDRPDQERPDQDRPDQDMDAPMDNTEEDGPENFEDEPDKPSFNTIVEPEITSAVGSRAAVGRKFVVGVSVLSVLLGAISGGVIGIMGAKFLHSKAAAQNTNQAQIAALKSDFESQIHAQSQVQKTSNTAQAKLAQDLQELSQHIQSLSARLDTAHKRSTSAELTVENMSALVGKFEERLAALEVLAAGDTDFITGENSLVARVQTLENRALDANQPNQPNQTELLEKIAAMSHRLDILDANSTNIKPPAAPIEFPTPSTDTIDLPKAGDEHAQQKALDILIETFPRAKMLEVVRAQHALAQEKPGWIKRTLSKHIKVRNDDLPDPFILIDKAQDALNNGDVDLCLQSLKKLTPSVQTAAAEWMQAAKKAVKMSPRDLKPNLHNPPAQRQEP